MEEAQIVTWTLFNLLLCKMGVSLYPCSLWRTCVSLTCCHSERRGKTRAELGLGRLSDWSQV